MRQHPPRNRDVSTTRPSRLQKSPCPYCPFGPNDRGVTVLSHLAFPTSSRPCLASLAGGAIPSPSEATAVRRIVFAAERAAAAARARSELWARHLGILGVGRADAIVMVSNDGELLSEPAKNGLQVIGEAMAMAMVIGRSDAVSRRGRLGSSTRLFELR